MYSALKKSTQAPVSLVTPAQKGCFCVSNGSVTPREEGFTKQTQVMRLGGWLYDDVASRLIEIGVKLEPWLRRDSWKTEKKGILHTKKSGKERKPREKVNLGEIFHCFVSADRVCSRVRFGVLFFALPGEPLQHCRAHVYRID
jgi:hypothetical protein